MLPVQGNLTKPQLSKTDYTHSILYSTKAWAFSWHIPSTCTRGPRLVSRRQDRYWGLSILWDSIETVMPAYKSSLWVRQSHSSRGNQNKYASLPKVGKVKRFGLRTQAGETQFLELGQKVRARLSSGLIFQWWGLWPFQVWIGEINFSSREKKAVIWEEGQIALDKLRKGRTVLSTYSWFLES